MSTLTGIGSYSTAASYLFSKIDTSGKGYIEKEDLVSAFSSLTSASDTSATDVFSQLDSNSDGKVTESEFSSTLQQLAETLNSQYDQARMQGAMPPPPPPPADDTGFTEDELTSQLEEIGDSDSARSTLISSIVENFDAADTDGDGKVSHTEAMAYAEANDIGTSTSGNKASEATSPSASASVSDTQVYQRIMELMRAYGSQNSGDSLLSSLTSAISTSA